MKKIIFSFIFTLTLQYLSYAQWGPVTICSHNYDKKSNVSVTSTNNGVRDGIIVVWRDWRSDPTVKLYAQKMNNEGNVQWTSNGVEIDGNLGLVYTGDEYPQVISDKVGGCVIIYDRKSLSDYAYAVRINSTGSIVWGPTLLFSSPMSKLRITQELTEAEGDKFIFIAGEYSEYEIATQLIDLDGNVYWNGGITLWTAAPNHYATEPTIVIDGNGGAIINWIDDRNSTNQWDIYGQRIDYTSSTYWTTGGILLFSSATNSDDAMPQVCILII